MLQRRAIRTSRELTPAENDLPTQRAASSRRRRAWFLAIVVLAVAGAAAGLVAVYAHDPISASWVMIVAVGLTLFQFAGASRASGWGVVFWIMAAAILSAGFWTLASLHEFMIPSGAIFTVGGFLLSLPAGILFLVASIKNRSQCAGNCAGCMIVLFTFVIYCISGGTMRHYRAWPESVQETRQLILTLHRLTADIETFRSQLGRIPKDETELVSLRGKPMPPYHQNYGIRYMSFGKDRYPGLEGDYRLDCGASHFWGLHWDIFPWIFEYFGPTATPRLHAEAF